MVWNPRVALSSPQKRCPGWYRFWNGQASRFSPSSTRLRLCTRGFLGWSSSSLSLSLRRLLFCVALPLGKACKVDAATETEIPADDDDDGGEALGSEDAFGVCEASDVSIGSDAVQLVLQKVEIRDHLS